MATVKGDVHDIGKNIVGVVLACNNYEVIDLGRDGPCDEILKAAREKQADMIGLSGLITPSLDEMVHVAREMERQGFTLPLLIGGATTSRAHTAVKIAPAYRAPVVHVLDASRAVGVVGQLKSADCGRPTRPRIARSQETLRAGARQETRRRRRCSPRRGARRRAPRFDWQKLRDRAAGVPGDPRARLESPLDELVPFIDWSPFFHTWELQGQLPADLRESASGARGRKELFDDAQALLARIVDERLLTARGGLRLLPGQQRRRRHRGLHRRGALGHR